MVFADRQDAGRRLAARLQQLHGQRVVVLGLPRGGVPVAFEVARALGAPLDVIMVRKLGVPFQPELGMGAIGEDGVRILNQGVIERGGISADELAVVKARERAELERRASRYRQGSHVSRGRLHRRGGRRWHRHRVDRPCRLPRRASARSGQGGACGTRGTAGLGSQDRARRG